MCDTTWCPPYGAIPFRLLDEGEQCYLFADDGRVDRSFIYEKHNGCDRCNARVLSGEQPIHIEHQDLIQEWTLVKPLREES